MKRGKFGMLAILVLVLSFSLVTAVPAAAGEQTTVLNAVADTYIRAGAPNTNEGASPIMRIQAAGDNRALIRFDQSAITSTIGGGILLSAKLQVDIIKNANNWGKEGRTIDVHRLNMGWVEGNGKNAELPAREQFRGTGAGATWNYAIDTNIANQKPDGTPDNDWEMRLKRKGPNNPPWQESPTASLLITKKLTGTLEFDVTADVAAFLSGTPNYGWIIKKTDENQAGHIDLASRENPSGTGPRLVLTYIRDTTPPVITPQITGTLGNNGWYTSDVTVTWNVEDPESGIASSSGSEPTTINMDTAGITLTCSATNGAGLSSSVSVTIKRDATPPAVIILQPANGASYLIGTAVVADYAASDALSGIATVSGTVPLGTNIDTGSVGVKTFTVTAIDQAGNTASQSVTYEIYNIVTLNSPTRDSFIREGALNTNEGANPGLRIQGSGDNRVLVAFDLAGLPTSRVTEATLVLVAFENTGPGSTGPKFETANWGSTGRTMDAHRLLTNWAEGNGKNSDIPASDRFRGTGAGVTYNCAIDSDINNEKPDGTLWGGGDGQPKTAPDLYAPTTAPSVLITNGYTGEVSFDVTADVRAGATFGWLVRKTDESQSGVIHFHSKEGTGTAPRLILEFGP